LPVNSKKTKDPGDCAGMMTARRSFLESGYYEPLAVNLAKIIKNLSVLEQLNILDIGCGEGYYTGFVKKENPSINMLGLDISKAAVKYASKKYKDVSFCVASAYELPLPDKSVDIILRVFAPSFEPELSRVINNNGYLIAVTPGERHLFQLRKMIYKDVQSSPAKPVCSDAFLKTDTKKIKFTIILKDSYTIDHLISMTPFGWKISEDEKLRLLKMNNFEIECDFIIEIFTKLPCTG